MGQMDLIGTKKARKPFVCAICGETFQPPSRYLLVKLGHGRPPHFRKVCLICERYG